MAGPAGNVQAQEKVYDYVIQNVLVYDGKSNRPDETDVAINNEYIVAVGKVNAADARKVIEGDGLILTPGFIDAHTHSDFNPFVYPNLPNKLLQGVTTEITGNCGMSAAPVLGAHESEIHGVWKREGVALPEKIPWKTYKEYADSLHFAGLMTNHAVLIGHGNLRSSVMGFEKRKPSSEELDSMKELLRESLEDGAYGISFGLVYLPGLFAAGEEIIELCKEAALYGGVCAFHMRGEGKKLLESIQEVIDVGEKTGARIQISHLKAAGKENWSKIEEALSMIEAARRRGVNVRADAYPYTASFAELGVLLPDEIFERPDRLEYLQDPASREAVLNLLREHYKKKQTDWGNIWIASAVHKNYANAQGRSILDLAAEKKISPEEYLVGALTDNAFEVNAFNFSQSPDVMARVLSASFTAVGSDSIADGSGHTHPRSFGSFPKVLKPYVKEKNPSVLAEQINRMTSTVAGHFGLSGRGWIRPGYYADLVLFDPESLTDLATYREPALAPRGVRWVFINGKPVVEEGVFAGIKAGQILEHEAPSADVSVEAENKTR